MATYVMLHSFPPRQVSSNMDHRPHISPGLHWCLGLGWTVIEVIIVSEQSGGRKLNGQMNVTVQFFYK